MLNATVFSLCVLSNGDQVNSVVASVDTLDAATRSNVGVEVEHTESESE